MNLGGLYHPGIGKDLIGKKIWKKPIREQRSDKANPCRGFLELMIVTASPKLGAVESKHHLSAAA